MTTPTPEAIQADAVAAARAALEQRLSWASLDWPNLYPNMIDAIIGTVVPAAAPIIAAQAKGEVLSAVIGQMELSERRFAESKDYPETPEFIRGFREGRYKVQHIRNELDFNAKARARRAATIEGKSE